MTTAIVQHKQQRMIAINPGSKYLGIAIFDGEELIDWRIRVLRRGKQQDKSKQALAIIDDLCLRYQPQVLVLKRLHPKRSSLLLNQLVAQISTAARRHNLCLHWLSAAQMIERLTPGHRSSKLVLFERAVITYPSLARELAAERVNKQPYHGRVLEAVALGMTWLLDRAE